MPADVTERWSGRADYVRGVKASAAWDVDGVTDAEQARLAVIAKVAWAGLNGQHPLDARLFGMSEPSVKPNGPAAWIVSQTYEIPPHGTWAPVDKDPLDRPPLFMWKSGSVDEETYRDANDVIMVNTAGFPFDPPLPLARRHRFFTVSRWESKYDIAKAEQFEDTFNQTPLDIPLTPGPVAPGRVKMISYAPTEAYDETSTRVPVAYEFEMWAGTHKDEDGYWDSFKWRILSQGYQAWGNLNGKKVIGRIVTDRGQELSSPAYLDQRGLPVDRSLYKLRVDNGESLGSFIPFDLPPDDKQVDAKLIEVDSGHAFLKYAKCKSADWSGLNIFQPVGKP